MMNNSDYLEFKASPDEMHLASCEICGCVQAACDMDEYESGFYCSKCMEKEAAEWYDMYCNEKTSIEDVETVEVLDIIDPPYTAEILIEFTMNSERFTGTSTGNLVEPNCYRWDGSPIEDITKVK